MLIVSGKRPNIDDLNLDVVGVKVNKRAAVVVKETNQIKGVHILAPSAGDLIHEATLAVKFKLTTHDIIDTLHAFPTLSESLKIAAQSFTKDISKLSCCV